jgi:hypothetical protein
MLLCARGLCRTNQEKTLGCNLFAPVRAYAHRYMQKVAMPSPTAPPCRFFLVLSEAVLLTKSFT